MSSKTKGRQKARTCPLKTLLVERGLFTDETEASRWVMAGKILVNEQKMAKCGTLVPVDAQIRVLKRKRYASRGGYKLEAALRSFQIETTERVALDCGASTGGFTDCLLQQGASFVYAVDAGFGQLLGSLRTDSRVSNLERTNLSDLLSMKLNPSPTLITLDLSYLSLTKALPIAAQLVIEGEILALFKPLFEVESPTARRTGKIDDPELLTTALQQVLTSGTDAGLLPQGIVKLALRPRYGVNEFFLHFTTNHQITPKDFDLPTLLQLVNSPGIGLLEED